jgi:hypothetical protein
MAFYASCPLPRDKHRIHCLTTSTDWVDVATTRIATLPTSELLIGPRCPCAPTTISVAPSSEATFTILSHGAPRLRTRTADDFFESRVQRDRRLIVTRQRSRRVLVRVYERDARARFRRQRQRLLQRQLSPGAEVGPDDDPSLLNGLSPLPASAPEHVGSNPGYGWPQVCRRGKAVKWASNPQPCRSPQAG